MKATCTVLSASPILLAALLATGATPHAEAAKVTLASATAPAGGAVTLSLAFDKAGAGVTALDVSFLFSAPLSFVAAGTGSAATAAQKQVQAVPISGGVRLVVFGTNQASIESGVLATLAFSIATGAPNASYIVTASNPSASGPGGNVVPLSADGGVVTIGSGGAQELLLSGGGVSVTCTFKNPYNGQTGNAVPIPQNDSFGFFYYGDRNNPEIFAKVLDFGSDKPYLIFFGGLTDFQVSVTYTVLRTGQKVTLSKDAYNFNGGGNATTLLH